MVVEMTQRSMRFHTAYGAITIDEVIEEVVMLRKVMNDLLFEIREEQPTIFLKYHPKLQRRLGTIQDDS